MKPIGPLMWEHRLIEKMLAVAGREAQKIRESRKVDPVFIDTAVDFIRTYADRTPPRQGGGHPLPGSREQEDGPRA